MNQTETIDYKHGTTYAITVTALMTAVTCILAPLSIPIGPVPISLTNLAIYISLYLLGWKRGTISYLIYLLIGLVGIPVFSGFTGGPAKLAGPTGGYIIGTVSGALSICVFPFIPGDLIKMIIAMLIGPAIKKRLR